MDRGASKGGGIDVCYFGSLASSHTVARGSFLSYIEQLANIASLLASRERGLWIVCLLFASLLALPDGSGISGDHFQYFPLGIERILNVRLRLFPFLLEDCVELPLCGQQSGQEDKPSPAQQHDA